MNRRSGACLRCCLVIFAVVSALCVSGPALYFKFNKGLKLKASSACPPCICNCAPPQSLFQIAPVCGFMGHAVISGLFGVPLYQSTFIISKMISSILKWEFDLGIAGFVTSTSFSVLPYLCDICTFRDYTPSSRLANLSVTDCGKDDPDLKEEMEKQFVDLLSEELKLQETVDEESSRHMNITFGEARRLASQYQREAEKCNIATETCEGARERAVVLFAKEKKITLLWERRARQLGWDGE